MPSTPPVYSFIANPEEGRFCPEEIKGLSSESKQIFDKVQADCKLEKPTHKVTGELKQNKGDKRETVRTQNTGGDKCPLLFKDSMTENVTLTETNMEDLVGKDKNTSHVDRTMSSKTAKKQIPKTRALTNAPSRTKPQKRLPLKH